MKKYFIDNRFLFQDLLISVDQLTESEGVTSFTIDSCMLKTSIECAFSFEAGEMLKKILNETKGKPQYIQIINSDNHK
jgi:hypothetical protein